MGFPRAVIMGHDTLFGLHEETRLLDGGAPGH
jgi:hypothetical protein